MWVERIIEATGWNPVGLDLPWRDVEESLGTPLPADYKEIANQFGKGEFSEFLRILSVDATGQFDLAHVWRRFATTSPRNLGEPILAPYSVFHPNHPGLIPWAFGELDCSYFWLADANQDPSEWKIVTKGDRYPWQEVQVSTSEFIYRLLTDPEFEPFSIAHLFPDPDFFAFE